MMSVIGNKCLARANEWRHIMYEAKERGDKTAYETAKEHVEYFLERAKQADASEEIS